MAWGRISQGLRGTPCWGGVFLEKYAGLDGLEAYFSRKRLAWMAWERISRGQGWPGGPGGVFLEKRAGLDGLGGIFLEDKAGLDGLEAYFLRKRLAWMAWERVSRKKNWPGWPGNVFLEKNVGLDCLRAYFLRKNAGLDDLGRVFVNDRERFVRQDCWKGWPKRIAGKDSWQRIAIKDSC